MGVSCSPHFPMNPEVPPSDIPSEAQREMQPVPPPLPAVQPPLPPASSSDAALREAMGLPPLPAAPGSARGSPAGAGGGLVILTWCVGAVQFLMAMVVVLLGTEARENGPAKIGFVIGLTAVWPLLMIGLFSLFKRFRNSRSRMIIVVCMWALCCFSHTGNIVMALKRGNYQGGGTPPAGSPVVLGKTSGVPETFGGEAPTSFVSPSVIMKEDAVQAALGLAPKAIRRRSIGGHDLSTGSNERLVKEIGKAQSTAYHEAVEAYRQASKTYPEDAELALERVLFIEHFVDMEDGTIESASADHEEAHAELLKRFPEEPETLMHELERTWGDGFEAKALACVPKSEDWSPKQLARFALLRAQRCEEGDKAAKLRFAKQSFDAEPGTEAGLLLAEGLLDAGKKGEASRILRHPVFEEVEPWVRCSQMDLHFKLGEGALAVKRFKELQEKTPAMVQSTEIAEKLAKAGALDLARKVLDGLPDNEWSRERQASARFKFELLHGDAAQAEAAYRKLREHGFETDPFLGKRMQLLLKHPSSGWAWSDLGPGLCLLLLLVVAACLPLLLLVPVHYWSLLRQRAGKTVEGLASPWGLRAAWLMTGTMAVGIFLGVWLAKPDLLTQGNGKAAVETLSDAELLRGQVVMWGLVTVLGLAFLWRARRWDLFGAGRWSVGKSVGLGMGMGLGLRIVLVIYVTIFSLTDLGVSQASPHVAQLLSALRHEWGALAMVGVTAVFVPLLEELVFRGVLLGALARHIPFWAANLLQAACFTMVHEDHRLIPFFMGFALVAGLLVRRSGGLLGALCLHALNNLVACLGLLSLRH